MKALITKGCVTDHGGIVQEADSTFVVQGIPVHLNGMKHFCPKCKVMSYAIASNNGFLVVGSRTIVVNGDSSTCGSKYIKNQDLVVRSGGSNTSSNSSQNNLNSLLNQEKIFDEQITAEFNFAEGMPYFIETDTGKTLKGTIGKDGKLPRVQTEQQGSYVLYLGEEAIEKGNNHGS